MSTPQTSNDAAIVEKSTVANDVRSDDGKVGEDEVTHDGPELTWRSAMACTGASLAYFATVGFQNAAGVFVEYYTSTLLQGTTNFQISWLSSFGLFCIFAFAPVAGILGDKYGPTLPIIFGSVLELVALFMISLCREYYQFFLAQGFLLAVGMSFVAIPASGMVPRYFKRHRAVASGISVAGSSLGGVIWPVVMQQLLYRHEISFPWSMRIVGFIMIPLLALVVLMVRLPKSTGSKTSGKSAAELQAARQEYRKELKRPPFTLLCAGLFFYYLAFFSPFLFVSTYATDLGMSQSLAFYTVAVVNAASFWGRVLPGFIADRAGKFNVLLISSFFAALVAFCWTAATSAAGVFIWIAAYGFASGAIMSLQLACATTLVNENIASSAMGIAMGSTSLAGLFGAPIAGELSNNYLHLAIFCGVMLLVGTILIGFSRLAQSRKLMAAI